MHLKSVRHWTCPNIYKHRPARSIRLACIVQFTKIYIYVSTSILFHWETRTCQVTITCKSLMRHAKGRRNLYRHRASRNAKEHPVKKSERFGTIGRITIEIRGGRLEVDTDDRRDRVLAWYCRHWMLIREGFNVEPVGSSSLALSIPSTTWTNERRNFLSLSRSLPPSPLLPSASNTRMCGYRFRLFPQEHRTTAILFPAQCCEEIVLRTPPAGDTIKTRAAKWVALAKGKFQLSRFHST